MLEDEAYRLIGVVPKTWDWGYVENTFTISFRYPRMQNMAATMVTVSSETAAGSFGAKKNAVSGMPTIDARITNPVIYIERLSSRRTAARRTTSRRIS